MTVRIKHKGFCSRKSGRKIEDYWKEVEVAKGVFAKVVTKLCVCCYAMAPLSPEFLWLWHKPTCPNPGDICLVRINHDKEGYQGTGWRKHFDVAELKCRSCEAEAILKR